ncbi:uncharacterized protein HMPREF1541_02197 [Cyphellophora europaea CBS 101466]|uniref:Piwi domain-containing protein n=1 Tax=Cyphellophora europaea (strain CBS 101466) TaxID=1220924 RepID=W2S512_CYPE1|nr:uncharacterized protein HMPREF1541_02197 [Cyphellophora europaea CBS 101466]ETN43039.1 hypothetical protein HMPREF1541_02197 [Cyphellophora europaea CBS 101466]
MAASWKLPPGGSQPSKINNLTSPGRDGDTLNFSPDFMSGIDSDDRRLTANTNPAKFELSVNFFPVNPGKTTSLYQYRIESIVKIKKPSTGSQVPRSRPTHPKRAPLPRGFAAATKRQRDEKEAKDQEYLAKYQKRVSGNSPAPSGDDGPALDDSLITNRIKRRVIFLLVEKMKANGVKVSIASDYSNTLVTVQPIEHKAVPGIWQVPYFDEDEEEDPNSSNLPQYNVIIGAAKKVDLASLLSLVKKLPAVASNATSTVGPADLATVPNLLNIIFSHCLNAYTHRDLNLEPEVTFIGANKFYQITGPSWPLKTASTPNNVGGVVAKPGFFRSTRVSLGNNILLNINTTTSAFYAPGSLLNVLQGFGLQKPLFEINRFVKGIRVRTTYLRKSPSAQKKARESRGKDAVPLEHIFTVRGLPFLDEKPVATNVFFEIFPEGSESPGEVTVAQYWGSSDNHRINLTKNDIIVDCGRGGFIPARFLEVLPGQHYKPKTEMVARACRPPTENYNMIMNDGMFLFGINPLDQYSPASNFDGLTIERSMVRVPVVMLNPPELSYRGNNGKLTSPMGDLALGRWNLKDRRAFSASPGKTFVVIQLARAGCNRLPPDQFWQFANGFEAALRQFGLLGCKMFRAAPADFHTKHSMELSPYVGYSGDEDRLKTLFRALKNNGMSFVALLLPEDNAELYGQIKRAGDIDVGLHTVCHVMGNFKDKNRKSYWGPKHDPNTAANIVMKVNLKLSRTGANQVLPQPIKDKVLGGKPMIIGIDVTHPGPESSQGAQSVAAVVSSVDPSLAQWPASFRANPCPSVDSGLSMERVLYLAAMIEERLNDFKAVRNGLPDRLIIYRDGLSEEQLDMCKRLELPQVKQAVAKVYGGTKKPAILLVCSVKRHHARLFEGPPSQSSLGVLDKNRNPKPGTAVYSKVTYGDNKDFFLVSHETLQGTTRPCHYIILHNEFEGLSIADVANATHKLCYLFARATRSVSIATPAYYADLAADRARYYVRKWYMARQGQNFDEQEFAEALQVHDDLKRTMFYI